METTCWQAVLQALNEWWPSWYSTEHAPDEMPGELDQAQPCDTLDTITIDSANQDDEEGNRRPTLINRNSFPAAATSPSFGPSKHDNLGPSKMDWKDATGERSMSPTTTQEEETEAPVDQSIPTVTETTLETPEQQETPIPMKSQPETEGTPADAVAKGIPPPTWLAWSDAVAAARTQRRAMFLATVREEQDAHIREQYRQGHGREPVAGCNIPLQERLDGKNYHEKHGKPIYEKGVMDDIALVFRLLLYKIKEQGYPLYVERMPNPPRAIDAPVLFHRQHAVQFVTSAPVPWLGMSRREKRSHLRRWLFTKFTLDKERRVMLPRIANRRKARNEICWTGFWMTDQELDQLVQEIGRDYDVLTQ